VTDLVELAETRQRASELLQRRFSEGVIDVELYETRVEGVEVASKVEEIRALVADLRPDPPTTSLVPVGPSAGLAVGTPQPQGRVSSILGNATRTGSWVVPQTLEVRAVLGSVKIDLRQAQLPPEGAVFTINAVLGDVEVLVPPGMRVSLETESILSEVADGDLSEVDPHIPPLRVVGRAVLANVEIKERLPGESGWGAFWRRRRRARALRRARDQQRQLPPGP